MIHPDLRAAAAFVDDAKEKGRFPGDPPAQLDFLYAWYLNATELTPPKGVLEPWELSLPAVMRAAHVDSLRFEGGWQAERVSTWGRASVVRGDAFRVLDRIDYVVPRRPGLRAEPGDSLAANALWDWIDDETGYWHARRGAWPPDGADRLIRVYWNAPPAGLGGVMYEISRLLAQEPGSSVRLKTPATSSHGGRADALVLYLGPDGYSTLEERIVLLAERLREDLRAPIPRMTRRLAPGVSVAEGPLDGDSFGETRCRLIAEAAREEASQSSTEVLVVRIARRFVEAGLDPERPYREPGGRL